MRPHHQEKTRRVYADGLHQLSQSHQLTAPSGHLPQFSFLQEIDKLTNNHLQPHRLTCKYLNRGLHPGDVAVMIRSPDIDEMIIASRKLVLMVGNVRREISWSLVAANQNPVLIIAVGYGLQPDGILTSVGFPRILQLLNGLTDGTSLMEGSLTEPGAKGDTKHLQLLRISSRTSSQPAERKNWRVSVPAFSKPSLSRRSSQRSPYCSRTRSAISRTYSPW